MNILIVDDLVSVVNGIESGIDLVAWVHEEKKDVECIFMSSHADFDYARKALQTGSCEYVLLPCRYEEIEEVICKAVLRLNSRREKDKVYRYGKVVTEDVWLEKMLLRHCIENENNKDAIERLLHIGCINERACGYLVYIKLTENTEKALRMDATLQLTVAWNGHGQINSLVISGKVRIRHSGISMRSLMKRLRCRYPSDLLLTPHQS